MKNISETNSSSNNSAIIPINNDIVQHMVQMFMSIYNIFKHAILNFFYYVITMLYFHILCIKAKRIENNK